MKTSLTPPPPVADADTFTAPPDEPPAERKPWSKPTLSTIHGEIGNGLTSGQDKVENAHYRPMS